MKTFKSESVQGSALYQRTVTSDVPNTTLGYIMFLSRMNARIFILRVKPGLRSSNSQAYDCFHHLRTHPLTRLKDSILHSV